MKMKKIRIGVIGDFDPSRPSHQATDNALAHTCQRFSADFEIIWQPTRELENQGPLEDLSNFSGLWGAPGDHQSSLGMINAIKVAREQEIPYLGT